jgi:3-deoxy-D-manno-octulosonic-acid transferase
VTLISGTVSSASSRLGSFATAFTSSAYRALHRAGAVSAEDAGNLVRLGVRREAVTVTGDTRYDQVWARAGASGNAALVERLRSDRPTLVAGSTWPPDERVLLDAWLQLRRERPMARLVIAPHEPSRRHVSPIVDWAVSHSLGVSLLSEVDHAPASGLTDVVIVDRTGVLGDLYELAHVAYVGGGFHDHGLHSVLEPAAFGAPVIFGPQHRSSRDAALLLEAGGGASVQDAAELRDTIWRWFNEAGQRQLAGAAARELVRQGLGATERSASLVLGELV